MSEKNNTPEKIEKLLSQHYQTLIPDQAFIDRLDRQIQRQAEMPSQPIAKSRWLDRLFGPRALVPALAVLALLVVLLFGGPQQVVAQIQSLLGYVPGYGFVDLNAVRILPEPVSMTLDGVTMTVKQVVSGPEETTVVITGEGLPPEKQIGDWYREHYEKYGDFSLYETEARLVLSDGTEITEQYFQAAPWDGYFTFPTLPKEALEMTFLMPTIPGIPAEHVPQDWVFDIQLEYVDMPENFNLPEPLPINARTDLVEGIEVVVLDAVYASSEVSLRVMLQNLPADWTSRDMLTLDAQLVDDLGHSYRMVHTPSSGRGLDNVYTLNFRSIDPRAQHLTMQFNNFFLNIPLEGVFIEVDFGDRPAVGDTFLINQVIQVFDIPVHIKSLSLEAGEEMSMDENPVSFDVIRYVLDMEAQTGEDGSMVNRIAFVEAIHDLFPLEVVGGGMSGSGIDPETGNSQLMSSYWVPADAELLTGTVKISPESATLQLNGSFEISWPID